MDSKATAHVEHKLAVPTQPLGENIIGIDDDALLRMSEQIPDFANIVEQAHRASNFEHSLTNREAFKVFPKAIGFSLVLSLAIIMEGYDTSLLGSFYAYPTFREKFGVHSEANGYQVTSNWQTGLQNGTNVGQIFGLVFHCGPLRLQEDYARRVGCTDFLYFPHVFRPKYHHATYW
jgi:SP family general alpha glucoside:H+ symporter-like MFS transporter